MIEFHPTSELDRRVSHDPEVKLREDRLLNKAFVTGLSVVTTFFIALTALAQNATPVASLTVKQLYDDLKSNPMSVDKYKGKVIEVTGLIWFVRPSNIVGFDHHVHLTATGLELALDCIFPEEAKQKLAQLQKGMTVKATGVFSVRYNYPTLNTIDMRPAEPGSQPKKTEAVSQPGNIVAKTAADPPMGEYAVYQWTATGFAYQHRFTLEDANNYHMYDDQRGAYSYDPKTKMLTYNSGPLKGFVGLYYTEGPNANGPTICLDQNGQVPKPAGSARFLLM